MSTFTTMENFVILRNKRTEITKSLDFHYHNGSTLENSIITDLGIEIPFMCIFFRNLAFEYFLISNEQVLYKINKCKKIIEKIGKITDKILGVECSQDRLVVLTDKELMLFDGFFNLQKYIDIPVQLFDSSKEQEKVKINFGLDVFMITTATVSVVFTLDLTVCGTVKECFEDAEFICKYNKFACLCISENCIKFIEPNGLEHGDPIKLDELPYNKSRINTEECKNMYNLLSMQIENHQLLLLCINGETFALHQSNFFWYCKFKVCEPLHSVEDNVLITKTNAHVVKYWIQKNKTANFVINGSELYYTNLQRAIIPPPFYYKKLKIFNQINGFAYLSSNQSLVIVDQQYISLFTISSTDNISKPFHYEHHIKEQIFEVVMNASVIHLRTELACYIIEISKMTIENYKYEMRLNNFHSKIIKTLEYCSEIVYLLSDGCIILKNNKIQFEIDLNSKIDVEIFKDCVYLLGKGKIQLYNIEKDKSIDKEEVYHSESENIHCSYMNGVEYAKVLKSDVTSFLIHQDHLIYISKNEFIVENQITGARTTGYAEDHMEILAVKENSIVLSTRFGTLETVTNRLFSILLIESAVQQDLITEAALKCDKNHVDYSLFYEKRDFDAKNIAYFTDSQALSLFNCLFDKLKIEKAIYLECESIKRLWENFQIEFVTRDMPFTVKDGLIIHSQITNRLLTNYKAHECLIDSSCCIYTNNPLNTEFLYAIKNIPEKITKTGNFDNVLAFLNCLSPEKHFSTIVNVFVALNRVDLCFYLSNLQRVVKVLLTKLSPESICKASMLTFNLDLIVEVHKLCQKDSASFVNFFKSAHNKHFSVYDYLENRLMALFHLIVNYKENTSTLSKKLEDMSLDSLTQTSNTDNSIDRVLSYAKEHKLLEFLIMLGYHNIFNIRFYSKIAMLREPLDAFYLYKNDKNMSEAMEIAKQHLFWREALALEASKANSIEFAHLLTSKLRYKEAGEIFENYLGDKLTAIIFYLKDNAIKNVSGTYKQINTADFELGTTKIKNKDDLRKHVLYALKNYGIVLLSNLNEYKETYTKYRDRLKHVRQRLDENMTASQTTFTYSSRKSKSKALLKDRPGGLYENEYVLSKIAEIIANICDWKIKMHEVVEACEELGDQSISHKIMFEFQILKETLRREIEEIWSYKRVDVDVDFPEISKPELDDDFD